MLVPALARVAGRAARRIRPLGVPFLEALYLGAYDRYKSWADRAAFAYLRRTLRRGDLVVDVGANVGSYTMRIAPLVSPDGMVLAFEPDPRASRVLRERLARAGARNVRVREVALADGSGEVTLHLGSLPTDTRIYPHAGQTGLLRVRVERLDEEIDAVGRIPALLKVDTQGSEVAVLRGTERTLRHRPIVLVELWPDGLRAAGSSPSELFDLMATAGLIPARLAPDGTAVACSAAELVGRCGEQGYVDVVFEPDLAERRVSHVQ